MPFLFALVLGLGIKFGYELNTRIGSKTPIGSNTTDSRLDEVMRYIEVKYVDTVDRNKIMSDAISSMLEKLDPHSFFIPAEDLAQVNESLDGEFDGIGIEFFIVKDTIIVVSAISGGPSETQGVQSGDKIVMIDDSLVAGVGITNEQVIKYLRGPKGTEVQIGVRRSGAAEMLAYTITRDKIPLTSVDVGYMIDDTVGYIKVNRFSAHTYEEFMAQLKKLQKGGMKRLLLDLRGNPGGILTQATMIADEFIAGRTMLVYTQGKAYGTIDYQSKIDGDFENGFVAVLIDQGSASASEILAGALQDHDRGLIIGRRSFGKGLVQEQYDMSDGSAIRLTVARYYTPSGRCIQKPYDERDAYASDLNHRFETGEYLSSDSIHFPDSLKFQTAHGRTVYGGGGIMPDIFVPIDTTLDMEYLASIQMFVPQFVYKFYSNNPQGFKQYTNSTYFKANFQVTDQWFSEFLAYAESEGATINLEKLAKIDFRLRTLIKAHFARQLWKEEGFYPIYNSIDNTYLKGYEELKKFKGF
ncbi:S41 family peptidase [soil metagenome]